MAAADHDLPFVGFNRCRDLMELVSNSFTFDLSGTVGCHVPLKHLHTNKLHSVFILSPARSLRNHFYWQNAFLFIIIIYYFCYFLLFICYLLSWFMLFSLTVVNFELNFHFSLPVLSFWGPLFVCFFQNDSLKTCMSFMKLLTLSHV